MTWAKEPSGDYILGQTEYSVSRCPKSGNWYAYDGTRAIAVHPDSREFCQAICESNYAVERSASKYVSKNPRGRYSKGAG